MKDGSLPLQVTASDRAGNGTVRTRTLRVDATAPTVTLSAPARSDTARPLIGGSIDDANGVARRRVTLDGARFRLGRAPAQPLAEGVHTLRVQARDPAGNTGSASARILVDSTERLGTAVLMMGARGADVHALQGRLKAQGFFHGSLTRRYDVRTQAAVRRFQSAHALPASGVAGTDTVGALSTRIVIDQSSHTLTLYRAGRPPTRFGVAVGQPAYPTPNGSFSIVVEGGRPHLGAARFAVGTGCAADPARPRQPARHTLDGPEHARRGHPRHR